MTGATPSPRTLTKTFLVLALLLALPPAGCARFGIGGGPPRFVSSDNPVRLEPDLPTRVFVPRGDNTADIVLTNLDPSDFGPGADLTNLSGQLVSISLFLRPKPGSTPIEETASNATVRFAVYAKGEIGIYAGAGFLLPRAGVEGDRLGGQLDGATLRLVSATPGFNDLIGRGELTMSFRARRDAQAVAELQFLADRFALTATPLEDHPLADSTP